MQNTINPTGQKPKVNYTLVVLLLGSLTAFGPLSIDMYLPSLPSIALDFSVQLAVVQFSLTAFFLGLALGQIFYGPLSDRFGRKKPIYFGISLYVLASAGCALSQTSEQLIVFRFFQALGSCAGMVGSKAIVRDLFEERDSAKVFSMLLLIMGVAPILAPLMGGYVALAWGWRALFYILMAWGAISLWAMVSLLPETHAPDSSVRLTRSVHIFADILKNKSFTKYAISGGLAQAGMFAYITGSPFVFIEYFKVPAESFGWIFGANAFALITLSQINVVLLRKFKTEQISSVAFSILLVLGLGLVLAGYFEWSIYPFSALLIGFIGTLGVTFPNTTAAALAREGRRAGSASALMGTLQFTMAALASASVSYFHSGTALAMTAVMGACATLAFLIGLWPMKLKPSVS